jgi:rubrerythrin
LEYFISSCQWIDAFTHPIEEHVTDLLKAVRKLIPAPESISYSKGANYKWGMIIDSGHQGEDVKLQCRSCNSVKTYDIIFNDRPPDTCPVCGFDGEKKPNNKWYVIQAAGMGDRDIVCKKCRNMIMVTHYQSDFEIPESCPSCHFSG